MISDWQLPQGVTRGVWDYLEAEHIAREYDEYFSQHRLMELDLSIVRDLVGTGRLVADLGCGSGRALIPLVRDGRRGLAIDLSEHMLKEVQRKARVEGLPISCLRSNLVDLHCLADDSVDDAICLFSTLGMIHGADHRRTALRHIRRIIKPGGIFVVHVHNLWHNLLDPKGPWWLIGNLMRSGGSTRRGRGDKTFDYRGIRNFYLHVFTRRELRQLLVEVGFQILQWHLVGAADDGRLARGALLPGLRAQGWIVACRA